MGHRIFTLWGRQRRGTYGKLQRFRKFEIKSPPLLKKFSNPSQRFSQKHTRSHSFMGEFIDKNRTSGCPIRFVVVKKKRQRCSHQDTPHLVHFNSSASFNSLQR